MLRLASEWGVITSLPKIKLLSGEQQGGRVVTLEEEGRYTAATEEPLASIGTVLADTGLRPEECYQLRWEDMAFDNQPRYKYGSLFVATRKT